MAEIVKKHSNLSRHSPVSRPVIESEVFDATRKARALLEKAQSEANAILVKAQAEAVNCKQQAKEEGFEKGYAEGLAKFQQTILSINKAYDALAQSAEKELLSLCMGVAHKILKQELRSHPDVIVTIVREAIAPMNRKKTITVRVNPKDKAILQAHRAELMDALMGGGQVQFLGDADIMQGGCVVETEHGMVDARLETEMNILSQLLTGEHFSDARVENDEAPFIEEAVEEKVETQEVDSEYVDESYGSENDDVVKQEDGAELVQPEEAESLELPVPQTPVSSTSEDAEYSSLMSSIDSYLKSYDDEDDKS